MLGMTLADRLAGTSPDVSLFEAAPHWGGLASAWSIHGVVWDRFYHVILLSDTHLRRLLADLGVEGDIRWAETRTGFFLDGRFHSLSNAWEFLRFPPLRLVDKARLALTILRASRIRDGGRLERIPVSRWLIRWSGRRTFERLWLPLLRAKLGDHYRTTSAAFIWTTMARLYSARRAGWKKEMFGYVPGGYARIVDRFTDRLAQRGVRLHAGHAARSVRRAGSGIEVAFDNGAPRRFDRVVVTLAPPLAARLCPDLDPQERSRLERIPYLGVICASVLLRKPLAGFYVTNITESWVPFTAVIEMSALVDRGQLSGHHLAYLPKYVAADDPLFSLADGDIEEQFSGALLRMFPHVRRSDVRCFRVARARYVLPVPTLGYAQLLPPVSTSVPGIYLVNSAQIVNGTPNVNETVQLADRAAAELARSGPATLTAGANR